MSYKNRELELDRIWGNTPKYPTATSEIATLPDLYLGLEKSSYSQASFQKSEQLHSCIELVVFGRAELNGVLETLETNKKFSFDNMWVSNRINGIAYDDKKLGVHPSSILNSSDLSANPMLLMLLIGELYQDHYFDRNIIYDEDNREIILKGFDKNTICDESGLYIFLKDYRIDGDYSNESITNLNSSEAIEKAQKTASNLIRLSSLEERNKMDHIEDTPKFEKELELGGNLGLSLKGNKLYVDGKPIYDVCQIPNALINLRTIEKRLEEYQGKDDRAKSGINYGIEMNRKRIDNDEGPHYPMFKILDSGY